MLSAKGHQVELARRIQCRVARKVYRAAAAFRAIAHRSKHRRAAGIVTVIVVPEVKRLEVMRNDDALYFIRGCPETGDPLGRSRDPPRSNQGGRVKNIYVGNLDLKTTEESSRSFFEPLGPVHKVKLMVDGKTGLSRGFAFIEMAVPEADRAIATLHGQVLDGQVVHIREGRQKVH